MIKILKKGIRDGEGKYHPCFYSMGELRNYPQGTITVYARNYDNLPVELNPKNNSDSMTDYFETDHVRITPDHPLYADFLRVVKH